MVSYFPTSIRVRIPPSINVPSVNACCARILECLSASINHIAGKISLEKSTTINQSGKAWEGALATGLLLTSSTRNMKINVKVIWRLSRNITRCSLECPSDKFRVVNLRRSIRSVPSHSRNMITLSSLDVSVILIPPSLVTLIEMK